MPQQIKPLKRVRPAMRTVRSPQQLEAAARDVRYEYLMLLVSSQYLESGMSSPMDDLTKNLALEAFLLHYRNLRSFLCPSLQPIKDDDVIASDFVDCARAEDIGNTDVLKADLQKINKLLAHLSYSRVEYKEAGDKSWDPDRMVAGIQSSFQVFIDRLPPQRRAWFPDCAGPGSNSGESQHLGVTP